MFSGANMYFWIGVVENVSDPMKRGRVQVRVLGAHDTYNRPMTESEGSAAWYAAKNGSSTSGTSGSTVVSTESMSSYNYGSTSSYTASGEVASFSGASTPLDGKMARYSPDYKNGQERVPLWQCYNNPMNLKNTSLQYRRFDDISLAYPANYWQLCRYIDGKTTGTVLNTPRLIVSTWAPPNENPTEQYIAMVCSWTGLSENSIIDKNDLNTMAALCRVMTIKESSQRFTIDEIRQAFAGNLVASMTAVSSYYDSNGVLRIGSSTAVQSGQAATSGLTLTLATESTSAESIATSTANTTDTAATTAATAQSTASSATSTAATNSGASASASTSSSSVDSTGHVLLTDDLPWATILYPASDYGGTMYSTMPSPQVALGAKVFGFSADGIFMNQLFVLGVIPSTTNVDVLAMNPNNSSTDAVTGDTTTYQTNQLVETDVSTSNSNMDFDALRTGIWNAESGKSTDKTTREDGGQGAYGLQAATAAKYILAMSDTELAAANLTLSDEMKNSLQKLSTGTDTENETTGYWGSAVADLAEEDENIQTFITMLQTSDTLNSTIATAYLKDCIDTYANGDVVLGALYYTEGVENTQEILSAMGITDNTIPSTMTYSEFIEQVSEYTLSNHSFNFSTYMDKVAADVGGVNALEEGRISSN